MVDRVLTDTEKEIFQRYASFCDERTAEDKWKSADKNHFGIMKKSEKACYINFRIIDFREFDEKTGERIFPDGTYDEDTYIHFWCPKKLMGWDLDKIPYWFVKEKINEALSK